MTIQRHVSQTRLTPGADPSIGGDEGWQLRAACIGQWDAFYPDRRGGSVLDPDIYWDARKICGRCPVRQQCLDRAMADEPRGQTGRHGMFGGLTPAERAALATKTTSPDRDPASGLFREETP